MARLPLGTILLALCALAASAQDRGTAGPRTAGLPLKEMVRMALEKDPQARISRQTTAYAFHGYQAAMADALPKVDFSTQYSLGYAPLTRSESYSVTDQTTQLANVKLSASQLLPTAGSVFLSAEDAMTVSANSKVTTGTVETTPEARFSQKPKLSLGLTQPLFLNGKVVDLELYPATLRKARIGYDREEAGDRVVRNQTVVRILRLAFSVLQTRRGIARMEEAVAIAGDNLAKLEQSLKLGAVAQTDVWESRIGAGRQRESLLDLRTSLARAERSLAHSLGLESVAGTVLDDRVPLVAMPADPADLAARALAAHPLLRQKTLAAEERRLDAVLAGQRRASTFSLSLSVAPRYPFVPSTAQTALDQSFAGSFTELFREGAGADYSLSASLSIPLFDGGKAGPETAGFGDLARIAEENVTLQKQSLLNDLEDALLRKEALQAKIALLSDNVDLLSRRLEQEDSLLRAGRSTDLDVRSRRADRDQKADDLRQARTELFLTSLDILSAAGEDLSALIEGLPQ